MCEIAVFGLDVRILDVRANSYVRVSVCDSLEMVDEFKPARVWRILDTHTLSAMRPDCVPDNRHYVCGNCESELVLGQFTKALDAMRVESDSFLIALPAVVSSD